MNVMDVLDRRYLQPPTVSARLPRQFDDQIRGVRVERPSKTQEGKLIGERHDGGMVRVEKERKDMGQKGDMTGVCCSPFVYEGGGLARIVVNRTEYSAKRLCQEMKKCLRQEETIVTAIQALMGI